MIPNTRPVLGKDLDTVRQQHGLLTSDACWLFGLSMTRWMQIVRQGPELPVKDPTLALLVRFLDENPESLFLPKFPTVEEVYSLVESTQADKKGLPQRFSVFLGSEASATNRWRRGAGTRQSPAVLRLMLCLKSAMLARQPESRAELIDNWRKTVDAEGVARDVDDVFREGKWNREGVAKMTLEIDKATPESERLVRKRGLAANAVARAATKKFAMEQAEAKVRSDGVIAVMTPVLDAKLGVRPPQAEPEPGVRPPSNRRSMGPV